MFTKKAKTYKLVPADRWSKRWKAAKAKFEKDTKSKKPADTKDVKLFGVKLGQRRVSTKIESAIKKVEAAVPKAYTNIKIGGVARHLTQQVGNVQQLTEMGYEFARGDPTALFDALEPWADKNRKVDDEADRNEVLAEVDLFENAVDDVANWVQ